MIAGNTCFRLHVHDFAAARTLTLDTEHAVEILELKEMYIKARRHGDKQGGSTWPVDDRGVPRPYSEIWSRRTYRLAQYASSKAAVDQSMA